jgi:hypothetical protein
MGTFLSNLRQITHTKRLSTLLSSLTPPSSSSSDALPCSSRVVERIVDLLLYLPPSEAPPDLNPIEEAFF